MTRALPILLICAVCAAAGTVSGPGRVKRLAQPAASSGSTPVYSAGLTVWYSFNNASAYTNDDSGLGRHAVLSNGILVASDLAGAAYFTNKPYLTIPTIAAVTNFGTLAMRLRPRRTAAYFYFAWIWEGTDDNDCIWMGKHPANLWDFRLFSGGATYWQFNPSDIPSNCWTEFVLTWTNNDARFYLRTNGVNIALAGSDTSCAVGWTASGFRLGTDRANGTPMDADCDDFRTYSFLATPLQATNIILDLGVASP